ncbi:MAG: DUF6386 family protein [Sphingobium sp.]|uniref:DUF6386 family protein n=1 Tax=Sphingobium sp. TaxID=1912891 RepID=UPI002E1F150E
MGLLRRWFGKKYVPSRESPDAFDDAVSVNRQKEFGIYTSTSTIAVYDLAALKHRLNDDVDWWADPAEELAEINLRNLLIVGLGGDGFYDLDIVEEEGVATRFSLCFPSGRIFIGPGEMLTGGGDEPAPQYGGMFLDFEPGDYAVGLERDDSRLRISITRSVAFENRVAEPIHM